MDAYRLGQKLGEGTFGVVREVTHVSTQKKFARKRIRESDDEGIPATVLREVSVMKMLDHPNILRLEAVVHDGSINLILELCDENLRTTIRKHHPLARSVYLQATRQILSAVSFCHSRRIFHRDLKPQNIMSTLRDGAITIKVGDFGLTRTFEVPMRAYTPEVVTMWYKPPELLLGIEIYGCSLDVWAIGCIVAEMIDSTPLFPGDSEIGQLYAIFQRLGTPSEAEWPGVSALPYFSDRFPRWPIRPIEVSRGEESDGALLNALLAHDPSRRTTAKEARELVSNELDAAVPLS